MSVRWINATISQDISANIMLLACLFSGVEMVDTTAALTGSSRNLLAAASQDVDQNENPIGGAFEVEGSNPKLNAVKRLGSLGGTGNI
eukprot:COSAG02_NODE_57220_length_281_cov_1.098901_1_plen_87_part_01